MDINNIFNYYSNDGDGSFNPYKRNTEGFEFPIGSKYGTCMLEDGLVWTAFKNNSLCSGGSTYTHGLQAGKILVNGTSSHPPVADDPGNTANRIYRVRPDMRPTSDSGKVASETKVLNRAEMPYFNRSGISSRMTVSELLNQYWSDWNEWPANEGAPFTDASGVVHPNGGSGYNPSTCTPGFPGTDQTQWCVMNDMDTSRTLGLYASDPIGIEVQRTIWAYNCGGGLGNTIFISYRFINKSGAELDSMYVSQWADPDVGYPGDDAVGCDTTLNLGYAYNAVPYDQSYTGELDSPPPAVGFELLQGPIVPGTASDTATWNMGKIAGKKNLPMTSYFFSCGGSSIFADPYLYTPDGTLQWYNVMRGLTTIDGLPLTASVTGGSKYCYAGDPVTNTGQTFIGSGTVAVPGDICVYINSGPFTMMPGDTQQVVLAAIAGIGKDYLQSIYVLKKNSYDAEVAFRNALNMTTVPSPTTPVSSANNAGGAILVQWGNEAESFTQSRYLFEGYNVYQLSSPIASKEGSRLIATFDKIDGVTSLDGYELDPATGKVVLE